VTLDAAALARFVEAGGAVALVSLLEELLRTGMRHEISYHGAGGDEAVAKLITAVAGALRSLLDAATTGTQADATVGAPAFSEGGRGDDVASRLPLIDNALGARARQALAAASC
jgi:hypothetical protein